MSAPSCRIWGVDGFDLDVVHNLVAFYRRELGLHPVLSAAASPADLLVVQRPPSHPVDLRGFGAVHVWDYVGQPIDALVADSPGAERMTVFCASEARARELTPAAARSGAQILPLVAPVPVDLWRSPRRTVRYGTVHIGNHKPYYRGGGDEYAARFFAALERARADVWGADWGDHRLHTHGSLGLFRVSGVYAASSVAYGMMYPFQRSISFSGRFWHAPLNGCVLLSEPSLYAGEWPGVLSTDYTEDDITRAVASAPAANEVRDAAATFWQSHWRRAAETVSATDLPVRRHRTALIDMAVTRARLTVHRLRR